MTLIGTLWGEARQRQTKVILSIAALNGLELKFNPIAFQDKPAEFTEKFRYGKFPTFEGTDGFKLIEGATIARYLSTIGTKVDLLGSNTKDSMIVDQWAHFAEHEINGPTYSIMKLVYGWAGPFNRESLDTTAELLDRALKYLESHLAARASGYVALDTLTLADLVVAGTIDTAARVALGTAERAQYPHIFVHHAKVAADERVKQYWSSDGFIDVRLTEATAFSWS